MSASDTDLDELARRFAACASPKSEWTHLAHLRVGAWHVARFGAEEAVARLRVGIRKLNDSHGTVNSATSGYHETITRAYVALLAEHLGRGAVATPLGGRVEALLAGPLAARDVLLRFYTRETLMSPRARAEWVEPDLGPLRILEPSEP
jgi:hypothetical protein